MFRNFLNIDKNIRFLGIMDVLGKFVTYTDSQLRVHLIVDENLKKTQNEQKIFWIFPLRQNTHDFKIRFLLIFFSSNRI